MNPLQSSSSFQNGLSISAMMIGSMLLSACSSTTVNTVNSGYGSPAKTLTVCSGYGCILKDKMGFTAEDKNQLKAIMKTGETSASAERAALKQAISYMERASRRQLRYKPDVEFSYQKHAGHRGQMDCVDESLNTISYLKYLYGQGLLMHHTPLKHFAERGLLIDGRYPHKSARMRDKNGVDWAVDSWKKADGGEPEVITLAKWYKGRNSASQY